jgi:pyruvate dehydrogenase E1 component alpha subunit
MKAAQAITPADREGDLPYRVLGPDGTLADGYEPTLSDDELRAAFRAMLLSRATDRRAFNLQRQGRLGTLSTVEGQEASTVGSAFALDPARDWVVPQYRELPAMVRQGYPLHHFFLYCMGNPVGNQMPEGVNVMPIQISLAAQIPHAVGLAWGLRHQGLDGAAIVYFGDGASSEGDFHEAANLAGVRRAPVILFLQNNGWAISTPVSKQTAAPSFAARAAGYGIAGELVDGNDLFAVHEVVTRALARARAGEGPTLVESRTYRLGPHNTADDPGRYMDQEELERRRAEDPVTRVRAYLLANELLTEADIDRMEEQVAEQVADAVAEAEAAQKAGAAALFDHVFADPTPRVLRQRESATGAGGSA